MGVSSAVKEVCKIFQDNYVLLNREKCFFFLGDILSDKEKEVDPEVPGGWFWASRI